MDVTYPSVRYAGDALKHPSKLTPLILIDLPFSAALDTVMLPFDAARSKKSKNQNPKLIQRNENSSFQLPFRLLAATSPHT
tara:strand:- start:1485 stop:1727 length:243 start_codon:yes stop_codon:yes gene_type:complete